MGSQGKGIVNPLSLVAAALVILMLAATTAG